MGAAPDTEGGTQNELGTDPDAHAGTSADGGPQKTDRRETSTHTGTGTLSDTGKDTGKDTGTDTGIDTGTGIHPADVKAPPPTLVHSPEPTPTHTGG